MSTVTSQRRRRQACERCWKRKQKCDRLYPVCTACTGLDVECRERLFSIDSSTAEELGVTHASVVSYVESLKARISHLEHNMIAVPGNKRRRISSAPVVSRITESPGGVAGWGRQQAPSATDSPSAAISDQSHPVYLSGAEPSLQGTMGGIGLLSRSAMAEPHEQDTQRLPRNLTFENMTMAVLGMDGPDPTKASLSDIRRLGMVYEQHPTLRLTRSGTVAYLERFLKDACFMFPFLDTQCLRDQYDDIFRNSQNQCHEFIESCEDNTTKVSGPKALSLLTVYLAIATGALLSQESSRLVSLVNSLHASAVKQLSVVLRNGDGLGIIHCILCLAMFSTYSPHGGSTWHLIGLAMTKCISLGLHKSPEPHATFSPTVSAYRWRLFWSAYSLDRSISMAMDRPFRIQDEDITIQLDNEVPSGQTPEKTVWHHLVIHARLSSNIRANQRRIPFADYGNLCFWRDYPSKLRAMIKSHQSLSDHLQQLTCRTLIQIVTTSPETDDGTLLTNSTHEIARDVMECCKLFIDKRYERSHEELYSGSFIDACDIIAAGLTFVCLTYHPSRDKHENASSFVDAVEIIQKCSTLVTTIGERFTSLRCVQKVLLVVSSRLMTRSFQHVGASASVPASVTTVRSEAYPPINRRGMNSQLDLPPAIPAHLRRLLIHTFGSHEGLRSNQL